MPLRLPRWVRLAAVILLMSVAIGLGVYGIREASKPATLKLAVGALDAEVVRAMSALGSHMASSGARVRVSIIEKASPAAAVEAFAKGEANLALLRADNDDLGSARAVVQFAKLIVLVMVPPHSPIKTVGDLKGRTVGVVGLAGNRRLVATLARSYGLAEDQVHFVDIPFTAVTEAIRSRKYQAAIFATPPADRYKTMIRAFFPPAGKAQPRIIEIDAAEAIALSNNAYEAFDLPKGAIRGAPALPDDELSTLRVPLYLVASAKLSEDTVAALAKAIMDARRALAAEVPAIAQIEAPDDDKNAPVQVHPGAKAFFDGSEKTWSDKYGDWLFYGTLLAGALGSFMAGLWKFLTRDGGNAAPEFSQRLMALIERSRRACDEDEIEAIERECDALIDAYLKAHADGRLDAEEAAPLNLAITHLENAIERRSRALRERPVGGLARG